jgi:hypothetical protein
VQEDGSSFAVPLRSTWTEGPTGHVAASAARDREGQLAIDLAFLHTPHRLELRLDPTTGTFAAEWPAVPLFGAGLGFRLADLVPPAP